MNLCKHCFAKEEASWHDPNSGNRQYHPFESRNLPHLFEHGYIVTLVKYTVAGDSIREEPSGIIGYVEFNDDGSQVRYHYKEPNGVPMSMWMPADSNICLYPRK